MKDRVFQKTTNIDIKSIVEWTKTFLQKSALMQTRNTFIEYTLKNFFSRQMFSKYLLGKDNCKI